MLHGFDPKTVGSCWISCSTHRNFFSVGVGFILSQVDHMVNGFLDFFFPVSGQDNLNLCNLTTF